LQDAIHANNRIHNHYVHLFHFNIDTIAYYTLEHTMRVLNGNLFQPFFKVSHSLTNL